ncbi:MAG: hypothetical protein Q8P05_03790 [Candidatus Diapherotrites archaeon]|nr:hypothetical protein [Candidatus Diapherotrites archaeon]MDZ4256932.1 hypothetical protein [archaeon]
MPTVKNRVAAGLAAIGLGLFAGRMTYSYSHGKSFHVHSRAMQARIDRHQNPTLHDLMQVLSKPDADRIAALSASLYLKAQKDSALMNKMAKQATETGKYDVNQLPLDTITSFFTPAQQSELSKLAENYPTELVNWSKIHFPKLIQKSRKRARDTGVAVGIMVGLLGLAIIDGVLSQRTEK